MKLVKQTSLFYREGSSDKVYEVDLCDVGGDRYVVNYRYGRRGSTLKEGSQTPRSVPRAEAEKAFESLVASKVKKGYRASGDEPAATTKPEKTKRIAERAGDVDARSRAILSRLADAAARRGKVKKDKWPLERVVWRAGEIGLRDAVPSLLTLLGTGGPLRDYCIAWALGRCGDTMAMEALSKLYGDRAAPDAVRRIAGEALRMLSTDEMRAEFRDYTISTLPERLRSLARTGPTEELGAALVAHLEPGQAARFAVLDTLYLVDNEHVRPALLALLRTAPLAPNYFKRFRHIFKAAEYRRDGEVFGLLAYRFEKEKSGYSVWVEYARNAKPQTGWGSRLVYGPRKFLGLEEPTFAYGDLTRTYLRRRVWRTLRTLGELDDVDYVNMAVGALLPFTDADAAPVREAPVYSPMTGMSTRVVWDSFAGYLTFNHILYERSPRYELRENGRAWRVRPPFKAGMPAPNVREEAFPRLWERRPVGLLHLLSESECLPVHEFAARALRSCAEFTASLPVDAIVMLVERPYDVTARLGFDLARERYDPRRPDFALALALAGCNVPEARTEAHSWIETARTAFVADTSNVIALVASAHADTRLFARTLLRGTVLSPDVAGSLVSSLLGFLRMLTPDRADVARDTAETILAAFGPHIRTLDMGMVAGLLLTHPMQAVQELAGAILLNHSKAPADVPATVIAALVGSPFETVRASGLKLFAMLPPERLRQDVAVLVALLTGEHSDTREAAREVVRSLAAAPDDRAFSLRLATSLLDAVRAPEPFDGVHTHLALVLREDLLDSGWIVSVTPATAWEMVADAWPVASELGGFILASNPQWAEESPTERIVSLTRSEILQVREAAGILAERVRDRFRHATSPATSHAEMASLVRVLDSTWADTRSWWIERIGAWFEGEDFTPAILVSICDSVREDVRRFGRELITRHFREDAGGEYLSKLAEHPSEDLQLFASNFLERYASGDASRLAELAPYFTSVLARVNRARVAKERVLAFLVAEGVRSEEAARVAAGILGRQSATVAVGDRSAAIEGLLLIHRAFPGVSVPIEVRSPEVRSHAR